MLVLSRFLQGLSAAVVYTVGFALVADTVGQESIGQWMGFVISSLNVGMSQSFLEISGRFSILMEMQ